MPATSSDESAVTGAPRQVSRRGFVSIAGLASCLAALSQAGCADALFSTELQGAESTDDSSDTSEATQIRFGCEAAFAPYEWRQDEQTDYTLPIENAPGTYVDGFDIQLMKLIAEGMGREPVVYDISFDGLITALNDGQFDAVIAGISATEERQKSVDFSHPYLKSDIGILMRRDSPFASAESLDDLAGASIIGQKGSIQDAAIDQIPDVNHMNPANSVPDAITRLMQGTVDGVTIDLLNSNIYEEQYPDYMVLRFESGKGFAENPGASVAVAKGDPNHILDAINEVIDGLSDEERQQMWDEASSRIPE